MPRPKAGSQVCSSQRWPSGDDLAGPADYKQFYTRLRNAFPDFHVTVEDQIAEGDKVVTRWKATGTHAGEFQGIPPTGRRAVITGITIDRIANGKVVESWGFADMMSMMNQLGAVPTPGH